MWNLLTFAGSKLGRMIVIALAVGSILYVTIQYIQNTARDNAIKEIEIDTLQDYRETRERVDDAIRQSREANPDSSGSTALQRLRERQGD